MMLEEYWRNDAKCIVVNREPAAGVMRLTIVCQILYPYTAEAKGTKIIGNFGPSTAFDLHYETAIGENKWTKVHTMVIYEPQEDCGMGNDMLLTFNIECIEGSVCKEMKDEMTILIKDDLPECPKPEKAEVPLGAERYSSTETEITGRKRKRFTFRQVLGTTFLLFL